MSRAPMSPLRYTALLASIWLLLAGFGPPQERADEPAPGGAASAADRPLAIPVPPPAAPAPATASTTTVEWGPDVVSQMGTDGDPLYDAYRPKAAYNSGDNELLVVWCGDDDDPELADGLFEVFGQRVDAATGAKLGGRIRISFTGDNVITWLQGCYSDVGEWSTTVDVVYNASAHEYLVVWSADAWIDEKFEILAQRIDASTGALLGDSLTIGSMGPENNAAYDAYDPAVAHNPTDNEYLVVWHGDDNTSPHVNNEFEIYGQRLDGSNGGLLGGRIAISEQGEGSSFYRSDWDAWDSDVAYNSTDNEYLVVWEGADHVGLCSWPCVGDNYVWYEIFGQRLAADGGEDGNDFQISLTSSAEGTHHYCWNYECRQAFNPAVTYAWPFNEYLVVWHGDDYYLSGDWEYEIHGQRIAGGTGLEVGLDDFQISSMGPDTTSSDHDAWGADAAFNPAIGEYLVVWYGDDDRGSLAIDEDEIFGQRLYQDLEIGADDFRISEMGPDGNTGYRAAAAAVAANVGGHESVVFWHGDNDISPFVDDEFEIWAECHGARDECGDADYLYLSQITVRSHRTFSACSMIEAANGFRVAETGNVTFRAGQSILLHNGFEVASGGQFQATIEAPL